MVSSLVPPKIASPNAIGGAADAARMEKVVSFYEKLPRGSASAPKSRGILGWYAQRYMTGPKASAAPLFHVIGGLILIGYAQNYYFHLRKHFKLSTRCREADGYRSPQEQCSLKRSCERSSRDGEPEAVSICVYSLDQDGSSRSSFPLFILASEYCAFFVVNVSIAGWHLFFCVDMSITSMLVVAESVYLTLRFLYGGQVGKTVSKAMADDAAQDGASPRWLMFAVASGACAAVNGALAKLTTNQLTSTWAAFFAASLGLDETNHAVELCVRALFFVLNLTFNGVMWGLFTRALTLSNSTVRVSVINTSANFVITAVLGLSLFGETLPGLWLAGAGLLVAGSVIIGRRDGAESVAPKDPSPEKSSSGTKMSETVAPVRTTGEARKRIPARLQDDW